MAPPAVFYVPTVCSPNGVHSNLINYPARGREQAEVLRREKLGY